MIVPGLACVMMHPIVVAAHTVVSTIANARITFELNLLFEFFIFVFPRLFGVLFYACMIQAED